MVSRRSAALLLAAALLTTAVVFLPKGPFALTNPPPSNQLTGELGAVQSEVARYAEVLKALRAEVRELGDGRRALSLIQQQLGELLAASQAQSPRQQAQVKANASSNELGAIQAEVANYAEGFKSLLMKIRELGEARRAVAAVPVQSGAPLPQSTEPEPDVPMTGLEFTLSPPAAHDKTKPLFELFAPVNTTQQLFAAGAGEAVCKLLILGLVDNEEQAESGAVDLDKVIRRIGVEALTAALHPRCTTTPYWRAKEAEARLWAVNELVARELRRVQQPADPHDDVALPWRDMPPDPPRTFIIPQTFVDVAQTPSQLLAEASGTEPRCQYNLCRRVPVAKRTYANLSAYSVSWHLPPAGTDSANRTMRFFAATFAIPKSLVQSRVSRQKLFRLAPSFPTWIGDARELNPRRNQQHQYDLDHTGEYISYQVYRHSTFCFGMFRSAADRQGHTEALSQGCALYMAEYFGPFDDRPRRSLLRDARFRLLGYPRTVLMDVVRMPGLEAWSANNFKNEYFWWGSHSNIRKVPSIDMSRFNSTRYFELANEMLDFTRKHMTCGANVAHVLRTIGYEEPQRVLVLMPEFTDYLSLTVECGVDELGLNYTTNLIPKEVRSDWPPWQKPSPDDLRRFLVEPSAGGPRRLSVPRSEWHNIEGNHHRHMYGLGFAWGAKIEPPPNPRLPESELIPLIHNGEFDLVLVSNWHLFNADRHGESSNADIFDRTPIFEAIRVHFTAHRKLNRVVFFDGSDGPRWPCHYEPKLLEMLAGGSTVFVRELAHIYDSLAFAASRLRNCRGNGGVVEFDAGAEGRFISHIND